MTAATTRSKSIRHSSSGTAKPRTLALREVVARSCFNMGVRLNRRGRSAAAIQAYDSLFHKFHAAPGAVLREVVASGLLTAKARIWRTWASAKVRLPFNKPLKSPRITACGEK